MPAYILDTNAIIYYAGNDERAVTALRPLLVSGVTMYVPTVVIAELFSTDISDGEQVAIETILGTTQIVPLYEHIARLAADIRRMHRVKFPDSAIAATALITQSTLLTRNVRDFRRVPGLVIQPI